MKEIPGSHFFFWADKRKSREIEGEPDVRRFAALRRFLPLCAIFRGTPLKNRANSPFSVTPPMRRKGKSKKCDFCFFKGFCARNFFWVNKKSREIIAIPADSGKSRCPREFFIWEKFGKNISREMSQFWGNVCRKTERFFAAITQKGRKADKGGAIFLCRGRGLAGAINLPCTKVRKSAEKGQLFW